MTSCCFTVTPSSSEVECRSFFLATELSCPTLYAFLIYSLDIHLTWKWTQISPLPFQKKSSCTQQNHVICCFQNLTLPQTWILVLSTEKTNAIDIELCCHKDLYISTVSCIGGTCDLLAAGGTVVYIVCREWAGTDRHGHVTMHRQSYGPGTVTWRLA